MSQSEDVNEDRLKKHANDKMRTRELRGALPLVVITKSLDARQHRRFGTCSRRNFKEVAYKEEFSNLMLV